MKYLKESYQRLSILGLNFTKWNLYNPKDAYLEVVKHRVDFRFDPNAPLVRREWSVVGAPKMGVVVENELGEPSLVLSSATLESETYDLRIDDARLQPATGQGKQTSHDLRTDDDRLQPATGEGKQTQQALQDPSDDEDDQDDEDALADDSLQDPETDADDDEDAFEQEETLASDLEHTPDPAQQPEIDDDEDELTLVSDLEDAPPAADDDDEEEPWQGDDEEEEPDASDHEDAPSADALMQATKADVGADATADDQAGPRLATSAPVAADDGFSFSLFPKPGVSTEVAKEAMPANQAPPEESSGSGMPASEGAHADLESADVGNAAPSNERVVHHGELAP